MASTKRTQILFAIHIGFIFIGVASILLGPILPFLSSRFSLSDSQSGVFFILQVLGSSLSMVFMGKVLEQIGFSRLLCLGFCLIAVGIMGIGFFSWEGVLICIFINGLGLGLTIPAINLLVAELNPHRSAAALNILHFAWGTGAMLCQPFISLVSGKNSITTATVSLGVSMCLLGIWFLFFKTISFSTTESSPKTSSDSAATRVWHTPFAWLSVAIFFLYVGTETSIGGWITTYSLRLQGKTAESLWAPATTIFWAALLIGRVSAPVILRFIKDTDLLLIGVVSTVLGIISLLFSNQPALILLSAGLIGVGLAPIYPTNMARFTNYFGPAAKQNAGPLFISATLGSASIAWLVGYLSTLSGSLRTGLFVSLSCSLLMIALQYLLTSIPVPDHAEGQKHK